MRWRSIVEDKRSLIIIQSLSFLMTFLLSMGSPLILLPIIILELISVFLVRSGHDEKWFMISWELQWFVFLFGFTLLDFNGFYNVSESTANLRTLFLVALVAIEGVVLFYLIFKERAIKRILLMLSSSSAIAVLLIILFIFNEGLPAFTENDPLDFLTGETWQPFYQEPTTYELALGASVDEHSFKIGLQDAILLIPVGQSVSFHLSIYNTGARTDEYSITCDRNEFTASSDIVGIEPLAN
ncbi:MAG: hypothetical protein WC375_02640, partial [Methanomassiliicoccales archaeon]